jgi:hypothetical protein
MELKIVDGVVIPKGHIVVAVIGQNIDAVSLEKAKVQAADMGFKLFFLPPGTQVYSKESELPTGSEVFPERMRCNNPRCNLCR